MRKLAIVLLILLFAGAIIRPVLHLGHRRSSVGREGHHKASHQLSHCPICKLIHDPPQTPDTQIKFQATVSVYILIALPQRLAFAAVHGGIEQARAPPVA